MKKSGVLGTPGISQYLELIDEDMYLDPGESSRYSFLACQPTQQWFFFCASSMTRRGTLRASEEAMLYLILKAADCFSGCLAYLAFASSSSTKKC
jgi:hypothetical protein